MSWMAMLFYQPRLYVYHQEHKENSGFVDVVRIQEKKLYSFIGTPALWATVLSGMAMIALVPELFEGGIWLYVKLTAAMALIVYHFSLGHYRKRLLDGSCTKSGKFFRAYNEVPTILMIIIVIMVVNRPI